MFFGAIETFARITRLMCDSTSHMIQKPAILQIDGACRTVQLGGGESQHGAVSVIEASQHGAVSVIEASQRSAAM